MEATQMFMERYERNILLTKRFFQELSEAQLRFQFREDVNSVAWLIWHALRAEDIAVNRLVADCPQVFDEGNWGQRLNVPIRHFGPGMTSKEVSELSASIDLQALQEYIDAVASRTRQIVPSLKPQDLDTIVTEERMKQVLLGEGAFGPNAPWGVDNFDNFLGHNKGHILTWWVLSHGASHRGEAYAIAGLQGVRRP